VRSSPEPRRAPARLDICFSSNEKQLLPYSREAGPGTADKRSMQGRRFAVRMLCADVVEASWRDRDGSNRQATALLEDISRNGACLQFEQRVPLGAPMRVVCKRLELEGRVRYCVYRETGYFTDLEFDPGSHWSVRKFRPRHLLDPAKLVLGESCRRA